MDLRRLVRGRVGWPRLEAVARELARRYDRDTLSIRFLEADNWLSTPMVVNDEWFVKVISRQNSLVHSLFTTGRNLGAFSSGTEGFFEHFGTPLQMAEHELEATKHLRDIGLQAPVPVEAFEVEGLGVLVLEYLPNFHTLDSAPRDEIVSLAPELFASLRQMHDNHLAHGDLRAENVLVRDDGIYFIDATNVNDEGMHDARSYDLACALAALEPLIGPKEAVDAAAASYGTDALLDAVDFLDFVNIRPDHDFDAAALKGQIETRAS
ncbi:RIO1 family regulatory kinase/ATPase domain-containing protein [Haloferax larsenii]|uniref:non-specific serine/threonine protein kinase n=1 Tax=Haloferax larsenii TaxID=302484 RepID=A0A1H7IDA8_HALLR|nr:RIO1 family regulatory kinase/ATPase [Haloferax larsenii]SEK60324.1 RIO1 family protein [Haloferax larsenii]